MKYFLALILLIACQQVWADSDANISVEYQGSQQIKSKAGVVKSVTYSFNGVVAGTSMQLFDSLTGGGRVALTLVAATTAGTIIKEYPTAAYFGTGIFYLESTHSGTITTDIQSF